MRLQHRPLTGVVRDFCRSCLPGWTLRLAATSLHVNRQYRLAISLARHTMIACGESPFRQKGPTLTTSRDYTPAYPAKADSRDLSQEQSKDSFKI